MTLALKLVIFLGALLCAAHQGTAGQDANDAVFDEFLGLVRSSAAEDSFWHQQWHKITQTAHKLTSKGGDDVRRRLLAATDPSVANAGAAGWELFLNAADGLGEHLDAKKLQIQDFFSIVLGSDWKSFSPKSWINKTMLWETMFDWKSNLQEALSLDTPHIPTGGLGELYGELNAKVDAFCDAEEFVPSIKFPTACFGPVVNITYVPKTCALDHELKQIICDPAKLVLIKVPGHCSFKYRSASEWTGKECKHTIEFGTRKEKIIGGGSYTIPNATAVAVPRIEFSFLFAGIDVARFDTAQEQVFCSRLIEAGAGDYPKNLIVCRVLSITAPVSGQSFGRRLFDETPTGVVVIGDLTYTVISTQSVDAATAQSATLQTTLNDPIEVQVILGPVVPGATVTTEEAISTTVQESVPIDPPPSPAVPTPPLDPRSVFVVFPSVGCKNSATLAWLEPINTGGSPITGYSVTCTPSAGTGVIVTGSVVGSLLTATLGPFTIQQTYACSVVATNSAGNSVAGTSAEFSTAFPQTCTFKVPELLATVGVDGQWYKSDMRNGGTADIAASPGGISPALSLATTCANNNDKAAVGAPFATTGGLFGGMLFTDFVSGLVAVEYKGYKALTGLPCENQFSMPSFKMGVSNGTGFTTFVLEPYLMPPLNNNKPATNTWLSLSSTSSSGTSACSTTGGFGWQSTRYAPAGFFGDYRCSLASWVTYLQTTQPGFISSAKIVSISIELGTFNQGNTGYAQNLRLASGAYDWTWEFVIPGVGSDEGTVTISQ